MEKIISKDKNLGGNFLKAKEIFNIQQLLMDGALINAGEFKKRESLILLSQGENLVAQFTDF